eukprot:1186294-Prorocentrum_minimum.AAC.2
MEPGKGLEGVRRGSGRGQKWSQGRVWRGSIGQVSMPVSLRTRLKVKNARGILKVCCTVREGRERPKR